MGEVYEAEDLDLQVRVALKTVRPEIADHDVALERFRREIQLARKVTHPNVCRIFDVGRHQLTDPDTGEEREVVFLTMEHLEGITLAQELRENGPIGEDIALPIIEQMAAAIDAAHNAGIVHRDFKSSNVILVPEQGRPGGVRAVVTDFGLARGIQPEDALTTSLSSSGQTVGTPTYMAPEQVAGSTITPAVDVYALGIVVFEMMTGRPPFLSDSPLSTAVKRLIELPPPPRSFRPDLGSRWETGILRCLEKDPRSRFAQASDLVHWIRREPLSTARNHTPFRPLATAIMLAVAMTAFAGFLWWRHQSASSPAGVDAGRPLAAVIGFRNLSGSEQTAWLSTALQEMLSMELAASERLRVVSGDTVARARIELGLQNLPALSTRELDLISRNLGADLVVLGSYFMEDDEPDPEIRIDIRVHRAGDVEMDSPVIQTGRKSELLDFVSRTGKALRAELGYDSPETDTTTALLASYPVDPDATISYARGLDALRRGDPVEARNALESSLRIEDANPLAHSALASAWSSLGYGTKARAAARRAMELSKGLPREERLLIAGRYYEAASEWDEAIGTYDRLWRIAPDNLEYGLALARAQAAAGDPTAFETLRRLRALSGSRDPRIMLAEAEAAEKLGDFTLERAAAQEAAKLSREIGAWVLFARAKLAEWWAERNMGNLDAAVAASSQAWEAAKKVGDRSLVARALNAIATTKRQMGQTAEAREIDLQSLEVFRQIGDKRREGWALNNLGRASFETGEFADALRYFEESLELAREIDDVQGVLRALGNTGNVLQQAGRFEESERVLRDMLTLATRTRDRRSLPWARSNLAGTLLDVGKLEEARTLLVSAAEGFESSGERRGEGWTLIRKGELALYQGQPAEAEEPLRAAVELFEEIGDRRGRYWAQMRLSVALIGQERHESAATLLQEAIATQKAMGDRFGEAVALSNLSRAELGRGDIPAASDAASRAAATFGSLDLQDRRGEALMMLSRAQFAAGDQQAALSTVDTAIRTAADSENARLELMVQSTAHELRARAGHEAGAVDALRRIKRDALELGYLDIADDADEAIRLLLSS